MPFGALLPFLFQDGIHLLQSARSASVANTVLQRLRHSALQSGRYYLGSPMLALQWLRGQDEVPGTACQPLKTMGMYWNLKFGEKKHLISWNFLGGFCIFSVMAEAYFFEDSPPVAEDLRRSMVQWDDQQLAVRLLEAGGYGINVPYGSIWVFWTKIGELTSNCWCLTSNYWNCFTEFHQPRISVGGSNNVEWTPGLVGRAKELTWHLPQENSYQRLLEGQRRIKLHERALILLDPPYDSGTSYFTWNLFMLRRLRAAWPGAARQQRWMPAGVAKWEGHFHIL